jgi:lysophospholipase L1-like esterase
MTTLDMTRFYHAPNMRFVQVGIGIIVWLACVGSILTALSWLVRRNFIYAATMRDFDEQRVPEGALVFIGSSTIRRWETLARDFDPWPALNRGFGGAVVSQCVHFASRLVPSSPAPRAIVFYCGANDLAWGLRVSTVVAQTERFIALAKERAPETPLYLMSLCKTPSRFLSWRRVDAANARLKELAERTGVRWVDITTPMLGKRGRPRRELFVFDGIHPSEQGYVIWRDVLRARFEADNV